MADRGGPAQFQPHTGGADPTAHPGPSGSLALLARSGEPAVAGAVPVLPDLVREASRSFVGRALRTAAGYLVTGARRTRGRMTFRVEWTAITESQAGAVLDFLVLDCGNGELAFTTPVDGEGSDAVALLALAPAEAEYLGPDAYRVAVDATEVFVEASP